MDRPSQPQVDFLHPWKECCEMPVNVYDAQAVVLGSKVYIGGGNFGPKLASSKLLIYDFTEDSWDKLDTPTEWYALATYHSQLVLVGGVCPESGRGTNQLWVLDKGKWTKPLPPMKTKRFQASAVSMDDHLIVAGGCVASDVGLLDEVEVYDGNSWRYVQPLPKACSRMVSVLFDGEWYLAGGLGQGRKVYHTSVESLVSIHIEDTYPRFMVAGTPEGGDAVLTSVWKDTVLDAPLEHSAPIEIRKHLVTVGGGNPYSSAIHAYFPETNSWEQVGDLPVICYSPCTVVLPTDELLMVGGQTESGLSNSFRAKIGGDLDLLNFYPDGNSDNSTLDLELDRTSTTSPSASLIAGSITEGWQTKPDQTFGEANAAKITGSIYQMEVIDEEEFTVPTHGNMFEWEKYGFRLYISKTNLPPSMGECKINIRVSLSGQFQLPQDSDLFSPVFWINASSEFTKPVTLQIQHCALRDEATLSDLSFVSAKCSQKDLPYSFKQLDGGVFTRHSSYGSIQLKHFCGICVVGKKKTPRSYCAHLYQTMKQMYDWRFYFVITQDLNANNSVVKEYYGHFAKEEAMLRVKFVRSKITLDIPLNGLVTKMGWKITPFSFPTISKKDADQFQPGQWIPECQLMVHWEREDQRPVRLRHKVNLVGAKDFFHLTLNPAMEGLSPCSELERSLSTEAVKSGYVVHAHYLVSSQTAEMARQQSTSSSGSVECNQSTHSMCVVSLDNEPAVSDLMNEVAAKIPKKWRDVGLQLGLDQSELDGIAIESPGDTNLCYSRVFTHWKNKISAAHPYNWSTIVHALRAPAVGEERLADEIKTRHLSRK